MFTSDSLKIKQQRKTEQKGMKNVILSKCQTGSVDETILIPNKTIQVNDMKKDKEKYFIITYKIHQKI